MRTLVIDLLARAYGRRYTTHDVVGAGPRLITGVLQYIGLRTDLRTYEYVVKTPHVLKDYDIVFLSAMSSDKGALNNIVKLIDRYNPSSIKFLGGPISLEYYEVLKHYSIDYIVVGEAENTLKTLFNKYSREVLEKEFKTISTVKGLAFKSNNSIVFTGFPPYTDYRDLDSIRPYTRVDKVYEKPWIYRFYVEVLRGCSNYNRPLTSLGYGRDCIKCMKCSSENLVERLVCPKGIPPGCGFCSVPAIFGPSRSKSINAIVSEIRELIRHGVRRIVLSAPDFLDYGRELLVKPYPLTKPCPPPLPNYNAVEELLERIYEIDEVSSGEVRVFIENVKACLVDDKISTILGKYLSGTTVHIGLETASDQYNYYCLGKPISVKDVEKATRLLKRSGLRPYVYLVYGLPFMEKEDYIKTINYVQKLYRLGVEKITLYKFMPLPLTSFEFLKPDLRYGELITRLKRVVRKYNIKAKKKYFLNKIVKVYIIVSNNKVYGYPIDHGPVVFVKNVYSIEDVDGCLALVRIIDVRGRYVIGRLTNIVKCFR